DGTYSIDKLSLGKMKVVVQPAPTPAGPPGGGRGGPRKDAFKPPKDAPIPDDIREKFGPGKDPSKNLGKPVPVDKKYLSADTTPLTVTVEKGEKSEDIKVD